MIRLSQGPPHILLTDHLDGDRPILIYRVDMLASALADLKARGWKKGQTLEIPMGLAAPSPLQAATGSPSTS